jgi:RNA 2',3'-cyclic 3'-phosphodiesterase
MKRIFIAVKVDAGETLKSFILSLKTELRDENIKWTKTEYIHITLAFLGDTEEKNIENIRDMLKGICEGFGQFSLKISGAGVFKSHNDPRIIWAGINNSEELNRLNSLITNGLYEIGIEIESRFFKPHLTLGRIKNIKDKIVLIKLIDKFRDTEFQSVDVNDIILYESILLPSGPVYKPISTFII